jgi:hypothetical protein
MRYLALVLLAALSACAHVPMAGPPPTDEDREVLVRAWTGAFGPITDECSTTLRTARVVRKDPPGSYARFIDTGFLGLGEKVLVLYVTNGSPGLLRHEMLHALHDCEGGNGDPLHTDPRLWEHMDPESVEAKARRMR